MLSVKQLNFFLLLTVFSMSVCTKVNSLKKVGDDEPEPDDAPEWVCGIRGNAAFRVNNGDAECWSLDGANCSWSVCKNKALLANKYTKPARCGEDFKAKYGKTGYENPKSWCSVTKASLTPNPENEGFTCGLFKDLALRYKDGNAECWS